MYVVLFWTARPTADCIGRYESLSAAKEAADLAVQGEHASCTVHDESDSADFLYEVHG